MSLVISTSRALLSSQELHGLVSAVEAAVPEDETEWIEWKSSLDLAARDTRATLARHIIGMANRRAAEAARFADGYGYILVGVEPGNRRGVKAVDPADLQPGIAPYLGSHGPRWTARYETIGGPPVLVIIVNPPQPGDPIHALHRAFANYQVGDIFVRKLGSTERADPGDWDYLAHRRVARRAGRARGAVGGQHGKVRQSATTVRVPDGGRNARGHGFFRGGRRWPAAAVVVSVLLMGVTAAIVLRSIGGGTAIQESTIRTSENVAAESEQLGETDPFTSALLAVAAWRVAHTSSAYGSMLQALTRPRLITIMQGQIIQVMTYYCQIDTRFVSSVAYSPDRKSILTASFTGTLQMWNATNCHKQGSPFGSFRSGGTANAIASAEFSPDGKVFATTGDTIRFWSAAAHKPVGPPIDTGGSPKPIPIAFNPTGTILATGGNRVRFWNTITHKQTGPPISIGASVTALSFNSDGTMLATVASDGTARLWDLATRKEVGAPVDASPNGPGAARAVAFSPRGTMIATGGDDSTARLWSVTTRQQIGPPMLATGYNPVTGGGNNRGSAEGVVFSPDSRILITAGADGTVRLWDVATHKEIGLPVTVSQDHYPAQVAVSPDGRYLAITDLNDPPEIFEMPSPRSLMATICATTRAIRISFSRQEWRTYIPAQPYQKVCPD